MTGVKFPDGDAFLTIDNIVGITTPMLADCVIEEAGSMESDSWTLDIGFHRIFIAD